MDDDFKKMLEDKGISDSIKVALLPEVLKQSTVKNTPKIPVWQKILLNSAIIAAFASILTLGITEYVKKDLADSQKLHELDLEKSQKTHERDLEKSKFQFEVIKLALDQHKNQKDRAAALKFFTEIGLLEGLNIGMLTAWAESENIPAIATQIESQFEIKRRLYIETISIVEKLMKTSADISSDSETYKRFWELYKKDLIGIESREVANAMVAFGNALKVVERGDKINNDIIPERGSDVISRMRTELETSSGD